MSRVRIESQAPPMPVSPSRADVACFVGFVGRRASTLPESLRNWLTERNWLPASEGAATFPWTRDEALLDVPVPLDSWDQFDRLFAWEGGGGNLDAGSTWMGAAVRSFFAQGGRRCYVVRCGDPMSPETARAGRIAAIRALIPGNPGRVVANAEDRASWRGVGHLYGLDDVSLLVLPDLPALVASDPPLPETGQASPPAPDEVFVECSNPSPLPEADRIVAERFAPRCDAAHYVDWSEAVGDLGEFLAGPKLRATHLVCAVPLPLAGTPAAADMGTFLAGNGHLPAEDGARPDRDSGTFVHLVYPWLRTPGAATLTGSLEPPDGALAGMLARNALSRGTYRDAGGLSAGDVVAVEPVLPSEQTRLDHVAARRLSLIGPTVRGIALLSDVSASARESQRPGGVGRLMSVLVRACRQLGQDAVFEASGERLWAQIRGQLERLLTDLHGEGALRGSSPQTSFEVTCDRSTMTQNDIDNGRVVARVAVAPAVGVERITVTLAIEDGGRVSAAGREAA